jgi:5'-nucleotidase
MAKRLNILLTNDDGYASPGIKALHDALVVDHHVTVCAPQCEQSGIGHAFTFNKPISYFPLDPKCGMDGFAISGTPSDCVKIAISHLMTKIPDVVISGMNIGENSGISSFYSGTVAGAREGAFWRLPSIAFSVCSLGEPFLFDYCTQAKELLNRIMAIGAVVDQKVFFYNVNFPECSVKECKGTRITRQSTAYFDDRYKKVTLQNGDEGFIVYGDKKDLETHDAYDSRALINNYTTITPMCFDTTADFAMQSLLPLEQ